MPRLIHSLLPIPLLLTITGHVPISQAAQDCRNESEIPSSTPTGAFTDHGDGTVTHHATGLMWMKCPLGQSGSDCGTGEADTYTWDNALEAAAASVFAGHTDWRLPNVKELNSIVEYRCQGPAINEEVFPGTGTSDFWSSSPHAGNYGDGDLTDAVWDISFSTPDEGGKRSRNRFTRMRFVRSGQ